MIQKTLKLITLLLLVTLLTSCASKLAFISPEKIDLSGTWLLDQKLSEDVIVILSRPNAGTKSRKSGQSGSGKPSGGGKHSAGNRSTSGGSNTSASPRFRKPVWMTATQMTIEQVSDSMGIAYLNTLYRDVDWGNSEKKGKKILAGWADNRLIVISQHKRIKLKETYTLDSTARVLTLEIKVSGNKGKDTFTRVFRKKDEKLGKESGKFKG